MTSTTVVLCHLTLTKFLDTKKEKKFSQEGRKRKKLVYRPFGVKLCQSVNCVDLCAFCKTEKCYTCTDVSSLYLTLFP